MRPKMMLVTEFGLPDSVIAPMRFFFPKSRVDVGEDISKIIYSIADDMIFRI